MHLLMSRITTILGALIFGGMSSLSSADPDNWTRGNAGTLYAEWDNFESFTMDSTPDIGSANISSATLQELNGTGFLVGGNIYNLAMKSQFKVTLVPNANGTVTGDNATVYLKMYTRGSIVDIATVKLGNQSPTSATLISREMLGGFGGSDDVWLFSWTSIVAPAQWVFYFNATDTSMSLARIAFDIKTDPPASNTDSDSDGYTDDIDNCRYVPNDQTDTDQNGIGDACDVVPKPVVDTDGDGINDEDDLFPNDAVVPSLIESGRISEKLAISGCKTSVRAPSLEFNYIPGKYNLVLSDGLGFTGEYVVLKPAAKYRLFVDANSQSALINNFNSWVKSVCTGGTIVKSFKVSKYEMTLNKKKTQLKLTGKASISVVNAKGKTKKGTYTFTATAPVNGSSMP